MLQNDMGNTKIQDKTTGAVMGLREGFIPVGVKEHGGIIYIASFNPQTKESELGSIPSPIFNYSYDFNGRVHTINKSLLNRNLSNIASIQLSNEHFSVGDCLYFDLNITEGNSTITCGEFEYPVITSARQTGLVSLHLYANCDESTAIINLHQHDQTHDVYENRWYHREGAGVQLSENDIKSLFSVGDVIKYPNFKAGTVNILPVIETPTEFTVISSKQSNVSGPYYYDDPDSGIWVILPGVEYKCDSPLWVDKIKVTATIEGRECQVYQCPLKYKDLLSNPTVFTSIVDARYGQPYSFERYFDGSTQRLYASYDKQLQFENNNYTGGLCCVNIGSSLNTKVIFNIEFLSDIFYNKSGENYTQNSDYTNFYGYTVGNLEVQYNPYASTRQVDLDIVLPIKLLPLKIDAELQDEFIDLKWDHLLVTSASTSDSVTLNANLIGPKTLGTTTLENAQLRSGDPNTEKWFDLLAEQIIKVKSDYFPSDEQLQILIFNKYADKWYKNYQDSNPDLKWFSGYKIKNNAQPNLTRYQFCSLAISTNQTIELGLESSTTMSIKNEVLEDLRFFYPRIGQAELTISIPKNILPKCTWPEGAMATTSDNKISLNNIFPYTDSIRNQVGSTYVDNNENYRIHVFEEDKNDNLDEIRHNILQDTPAVSMWNYPESNTGTTQIISIDLDDPSVTSFTSTIRFPKIEGVDYASVIMPKGVNKVSDIQDTHTLKNNFVGLDGYELVELKENYPTFSLSSSGIEFALTDTPKLKNESGYAAVQYIQFGDQETGYVLGNNLITRDISVDLNNPVEIAAVEHNNSSAPKGASTSIVKPGMYHVSAHSFKQDVMWYRPIEGTNTIKLYLKEDDSQPNQWYLIKWSTSTPFANSGYNMCLKKGFVHGQALEIPVTLPSYSNDYNLFKESYQDFYVGNFAVFKVTDQTVLNKAEDYLTGHPGESIITDNSILQLLSLPHCAAVFEYSERFKGVSICGMNVNGDNRISALYHTFYLPDPKYFCFGYYSLETGPDNQHKTIVPLGHTQKENLLMEALQDIIIKQQTDGYGISND